MRARTPRASHRRHSRRHRLLAWAALGSVAVAGTASTGLHVVGRGETLSEIAADHDTTVAELAEANEIDDVDRIEEGRSLTIPSAESKSKKRSKAEDGGASEDGAPEDEDAREGGDEAKDEDEGSGTFHTVVAGETLSAIARTYGVSVRDLAEANGIADVHRIRVGDRLAVSGLAAGTAEVSAASPSGGSNRVDVSRFPARLQASPERLALVPVFEHWADTYGVPLDLLMAMTWLESGWQADVVSSAGAMGIGQIMPDTVTWMEDTLIGEPLDPFDPDDSIRMAARYLRWLLDRTGGDPATALAGYYQGLGAVQTSGVFPSTRSYVADVLAFRDRYF